jgi:pyruvate formate lyase activating enzyme
MKGQIFDIQRNSMVDGPGIRTTVFFKGCNLDCKWCHNPEGKKAISQLMFYKNRCKDCGMCKGVCKNDFTKCTFCGECERVCPNEARKICGKEYDSEEVLEIILKDKTFYAVSGGGVTFSGGECMLQIDFLVELLKKSKKNSIHTAVDTAGDLPFESFEKIMPYTDLFLYDLKCMDEKLHEEGTGRSNARILENLKRLSKEYQGKIIVRIPLIDGFNTDKAELIKMAEFVKGLNILDVDILPYHGMGENKSVALGEKFIPYRTPSKEVIEYAKSLFLDY